VVPSRWQGTIPSRKPVAHRTNRGSETSQGAVVEVQYDPIGLFRDFATDSIADVIEIIWGWCVAIEILALDLVIRVLDVGFRRWVLLDVVAVAGEGIGGLVLPPLAQITTLRRVGVGACPPRCGVGVGRP
jgi:hypothetical protein